MKQTLGQLTASIQLFNISYNEQFNATVGIKKIIQLVRDHSAKITAVEVSTPDTKFVNRLLDAGVPVGGNCSEFEGLSSFLTCTH